MIIRILFNHDKTRLGWHRLKSNLRRDRRCRPWNTLIRSGGWACACLPPAWDEWRRSGGAKVLAHRSLRASDLSADLGYSDVWRKGAAEALEFGESIISVWGDEPHYLFERRKDHSSSVSWNVRPPHQPRLYESQKWPMEVTMQERIDTKSILTKLK